MELLENLNPMQREAVEVTDGPQLIIAGAGSGKTRVITHKIAYLIKVKKVPPWRIFAATFTNKAANEMKERVLKLLDLPGDVKLNVSTFHSLCAGFLRREAPKVGLTPHYTIVDERDQLVIIKNCLNFLRIPLEVCQPKQAQEKINLAKINMLEPEDLEGFFLGTEMERLPEVMRLYQKRLSESDAADFEDLILHIVKLLKKDEETRRFYQERFLYILVDEYQDTNLLQFELVRLLAGAHGNLSVVGDEDQSIYSWRGAKLSNLLDFSKHFPATTITKLEQNYRSTGNILKSADAVISHNVERFGKTLWSKRQAGDPVFLIESMDEIEEARRVVETILTIRHHENIPMREIAIFYRQNSLSRIFEDEIRRRKIPYLIVGGIRFYDRAEVKDLLAYLKVAVNPNNTIALQRIINVPPRGIGERTVEKLLQLGREKDLTLYQSLELAVAEKLLPANAVEKVSKFINSTKEWICAATRISPFDLLQRIINETDYIESLGDAHSIQVISKKDNIQELQNAIQEYFEKNPEQTLENYFENLALAAPVDELQGQSDYLALMTLHSAKGLEFDSVFIVGMEEPIFPNRWTIEESQSVEEERRLFYVGITRAKNRVFLSRAESRLIHGQREWNLPSIFLDEIPPELKVIWNPTIYGWRTTSPVLKRHSF